jgi:hypothetical protein
MDEAEETSKEVYARFGLAVYYAQVLEYGLVNAMVILRLLSHRQTVARDREQWRAAVDGFMDRQFQTTLGRMIKGFREGSDVPPDLEGLLGRALEKRNWLAHHYFRERADQFVTHAGRSRMLEELGVVRQLFEDADEALDSFVRPVRRRYGISDEWIERELLETLRATQSDALGRRAGRDTPD